MATYTKNYNLIKPAPEDFGDVADLNANADKVDEVLKKKADLDAGGKLPAEQLPTLSYIPASEKARPEASPRSVRTARFPPGNCRRSTTFPITRRASRTALRPLALTVKSLLGSCLPWTTFPPRRRVQRTALRLSTGTERFQLRRFLRLTIFLQARKVPRACGHTWRRRQDS